MTIEDMTRVASAVRWEMVSECSEWQRDVKMRKS